ncbi:MAG: peptidoglycan-binding protein [Actinobacteria bacterium]|nr:MAG: peptidoglycan-binding protein [Actinomycetota bacterium]
MHHMKPIRLGDRGPAVEDIQRRLRLLGHDLGPTGIDGVFFGRTADAVRTFQVEHALEEDGVVGPLTWAALVDATFVLGDRMLYLRMPHFHGNDVSLLQEALNTLGFACGELDGIFGAYTEQALCEFQRNAGLVSDGIAGDETVRTLMGLRHVWSDKGARAHSEAHLGTARAAEVLARLDIAVRGLDAAGADIAERLSNLASATTERARIPVLGPTGAAPQDARVVLAICGDGTGRAEPGRPVIKATDEQALEPRLRTAIEAVQSCSEVVVEFGGLPVRDERELQRAATRLLDAVCGVFDR